MLPQRGPASQPQAGSPALLDPAGRWGREEKHPTPDLGEEAILNCELNESKKEKKKEGKEKKLQG